MYSIELKDYGFKLSFRGKVNSSELKDWIIESEKLLSSVKSDFGVLVDLRQIQPIQRSDLVYFRNGQLLYKHLGMKRSVVILDSAITTLQFREIARNTDIFKEERYIDASLHPNWEEKGLLWLKEKIEP